MHMRISKQGSIVEFWLTNEEKNNPALWEDLKPLCRQYTAQNYLVAFFLSGDASLYQQTRDLLLYNRRRLAEREIQSRRLSQPGSTM